MNILFTTVENSNRVACGVIWHSSFLIYEHWYIYLSVTQSAHSILASTQNWLWLLQLLVIVVAVAQTEKLNCTACNHKDFLLITKFCRYFCLCRSQNLCYKCLKHPMPRFLACTACDILLSLVSQKYYTSYFLVEQPVLLNSSLSLPG